MNIEDEYSAFCFDEAVMYIRSKLEECDKDGNPVNTADWVDGPKKNNNSDVIAWLKKSKGTR